jgi:hypothetical protein
MYEGSPNTTCLHTLWQRDIIPSRLYLRLSDEVEEDLRRYGSSFDNFGEQIDLSANETVSILARRQWCGTEPGHPSSPFHVRQRGSHAVGPCRGRGAYDGGRGQQQGGCEGSRQQRREWELEMDGFISSDRLGRPKRECGFF